MKTFYSYNIMHIIAVKSTEICNDQFVVFPDFKLIHRYAFSILIIDIQKLHKASVRSNE